MTTKSNRADAARKAAQTKSRRMAHGLAETWAEQVLDLYAATAKLAANANLPDDARGELEMAHKCLSDAFDSLEQAKAALSD